MLLLRCVRIPSCRNTPSIDVKMRFPINNKSNLWKKKIKRAYTNFLKESSRIYDVFKFSYSNLWTNKIRIEHSDDKRAENKANKAELFNVLYFFNFLVYPWLSYPWSKPNKISSIAHNVLLITNTIRYHWSANIFWIPSTTLLYLNINVGISPNPRSLRTLEFSSTFSIARVIPAQTTRQYR